MWLWGITNVWIGLFAAFTPCERQQQIKTTETAKKLIFFAREAVIIFSHHHTDFLIIVVLQHVTVTTGLSTEARKKQTSSTPRLLTRGFCWPLQPEVVTVNTVYVWRWECWIPWDRKMSKNTRIALVFGGFVTAIAAAFYPIFVYPLTHKNEYSKCQLSYKFSYTISLQWLA